MSYQGDDAVLALLFMIVQLPIGVERRGGVLPSENRWTAHAWSETKTTSISIPGVITAPDSSAATIAARAILERLCEERQVFRDHFPDGASKVEIGVTSMKVSIPIE